jgi:type I restriction enzyme S subunit
MKRETKFKQTEIGMIPEDWEVRRLGDEIDLLYGKGLPSNRRIKGEFPVYGSNRIIGFHNKFMVKGPGIIIGRKGTIGSVSFSEKDFWPIDTTYFVKLKKPGNVRFWYYLLQTLNLNKMNSHSAVPGLNRKQVYELLKAIPNYEEQTAIAKILSDLDSKIELLQKMNKTLEEIGQAIFKHWFVDFEFPNEEGKPYKSSGGEMVYNEELEEEVPKGWRIGKIKDLVNVLSGFAFSSSEFTQSGKYKLVTIKNVQDRYFNPETKDRLDALPPKMPSFCNLKTGDILLSLTGNVGRICLVAGKNYLLNQRVAKLEPVDSHDYAFSYFLFLQESIFSILQSIASGTAQQNLSPVQTKEIKIVVPPRKLLNDFGNLTNTMIQKINSNNSQIQTLSQIRDALLPKLMSGKIRVPLEEKE